FLCLLLVFCCCTGLLVACSSEGEESSMNTLDTSFDFDQRTTEDDSLTAKGYPPLPLDQQILWQDAHEMVGSFALCHFKTATGLTREIDGMTYDVIADERFPLYTDLVTYLQRFFTDEFIYNSLLTANSPVKPSQEQLACVIQASGADNATYAGHVFTVDSVLPDRVTFTAKVYYVKSGVAGDPFYKTPKNPNAYTTKDLGYEMVMTDNGWRFAQCPYLKG
ncbi:MAG: hypothetical protein IKU10_01825, partial [Clostridia bacterium]|nr:hypothetical protein [Clostridia bacterium]